MKGDILIAKDKHDTHVIAATDNNVALAELFDIFRDNEYYADLEEPDPWDVDKPSREKAWYRAAKAGDVAAAARLLEYRKARGHEYEHSWWFSTLIVPKKKRAT